jgi:CP family cyanate transporter-like MFS transporter
MVGGRWLVGAAIVLLALNLRVIVGSLGAVLPEVRDALQMSGTLAGVLTTLPVLCFAVIGFASGGIVRRLGLHHTTVALLVLLSAGLVVRTVVDDAGLFLVVTAIALAGAAVGNIVLPPLAKLHFPEHVPLISALYGAALMAGATLSSATTVPLGDALGGWRPGLAVWAILAAVTVLPWLTLLAHDVHTDPTEANRLPLRDVARSSLAWAMVLCFGAQAAGAYVQFGWYTEILTDGGVGTHEAGLLLGVVAGVGIPLTLALPWLMSRTGDRPVLPIAFGVLTAAGWLGLLVAPSSLPLLWSVLLGLGGGAFTWTLAMIGRRTRTAAATTALSLVTQSVGYLLAGLGPFGVGALHDATGSWSVPLIALIVSSAVIAVAGAVISRPRMLEDTLR